MPLLIIKQNALRGLCVQVRGSIDFKVQAFLLCINFLHHYCDFFTHSMYHLKTLTLSSWNIIFEEIEFSGIYEVTAEKILLQGSL